MRLRRMSAALVGVVAAIAAAQAPAANAAPNQFTINWGAQATIPGVGGSSDAPAITSCTGGQYDGVYLLWKGAGNDQRIFFNKMDGNGNWGNQVALPFGGTSTTPSIACGNDELIAVWKGIGDDERIFYSIGWNGGANWTPQEVVDGAPTTDLTPTVAWLPGAGIYPYMVWKGAGSDRQIYYSSWDGAWGEQAPVPGAFSDTAPRATYDLGGFGVVWKGVGSDPHFWMQRTGLSGEGWQNPVMIVPDGGTSATPGITSIGPQLMVWKGVGDDQRVFYSTGIYGCNAALPQCWNPQQQVTAVGGTSGGPSVAYFYPLRSGGSISHVAVLVWKGVPGDQRLFYSMAVLPN